MGNDIYKYEHAVVEQVHGFGTILAPLLFCCLFSSAGHKGRMGGNPCNYSILLVSTGR